MLVVYLLNYIVHFGRSHLNLLSFEDVVELVVRYHAGLVFVHLLELLPEVLDLVVAGHLD